MNVTPGIKIACVALSIALGNWVALGEVPPEVSTVPAVIPPLLLLAPRDATPIDAQIRASQLRLARTLHRGPELERLGWLFIAKARASSDPGFCTLAGLAADELERSFSLDHAAWLLRGHVFQTQHRFAAAAELGRRLVAARGSAADHALLGDALYDLGHVGDAAAAYQQMMDIKPGLDSYSRAANIRWIKGDLVGAVELQTLAVRAGGPGDPGALAWSLVRLGQLLWQQGNAAHASVLAERAMEHVADFQPALLLQGRLLLAAGNAEGALTPLERAVQVLPLPETCWVYGEALRAAGDHAKAGEWETRLVRDGIAEDPRTVALFLATRGRDLPLAVQLAAAELTERTDIRTHAVNALALGRAGRLGEALVHSRAARQEGTRDAQLLLHTGRIAALAGEPEAADLLQGAVELQTMLLPSERQLLTDTFALISGGSGPLASAHETTQP